VKLETKLTLAAAAAFAAWWFFIRKPPAPQLAAADVPGILGPT